MFNNISSKRMGLVLGAFFVVMIAVLYYPFQLFFSGKWEARPYVSFLTIEELRQGNAAWWNSSTGVWLSEFLQSMGVESIGFRYYSLTLFIGSILGLFMMIYFFSKQAIAETTAEKIFVNAIILGLIGSRGLFVLVNLSYFQEKPQEILNLLQGGLSLYGGMVLVFLYLIYFAWRNKYRLLQLTDALVPSTLMVMIWGRFGNFFNYEGYGPATQVPWRMFVPEGAVINNRYNLNGKLEQLYHPTFLYEMLVNIVLLVFLATIYDKWSSRMGLITAIFMIGYGSARYMLEYLRLDASYINTSFTVGQLFSVILVILGITIAIYSSLQSTRRL
jgi:phosphatidylglycerol---prolipoprotein diacylglyceryl transferase